MAVKMYSAQVAEAVVEAMVDCFHYKEDLGSFLVRCGVPVAKVQACQFSRNGPPRRTSSRMLVDSLMANPALGTGELAAIIGGLLAEDLDFPRLAKLEEGVDKVQKARRTLQKLKDCLGDTPVPTPSSSDQFADRRQEAAVRRHRAEMLRGLNERFLAMFASTDPHGRGKAFEGLLRDLFEYFDLSPRGSFRPEAEEIDGSIVHEGTHILVEAKWHSAPIEASSIAIFRAKVDDKLKTTIGLYISMSGYTQGAIDKAGSAGARSMILVEGSELMPVLEGRVDFCDLLARKIRRAHETGCALFKPFN